MQKKHVYSAEGKDKIVQQRGVTGKSLCEKVKELRSSLSVSEASEAASVYYIDEPMDVLEPIKQILKPGDLFITLGAGNNWPLGLELFNFYKSHGTGGLQ